MTKGRMPSPVCGPLLLALLLAACGDRSVPSAEENDQLNHAANMLDDADNALEGIDANSLGEPDNQAAQPAP